MRKEIMLSGNKQTMLYTEIASYLEDEDEFECYEQIEKYINHKVLVGIYKKKNLYLIEDSFYQLDDKRSYTFNTQFQWVLVECTKEGLEAVLTDEYYLKKFIQHKKENDWSEK